MLLYVHRSAVYVLCNRYAYSYPRTIRPEANIVDNRPGEIERKKKRDHEKKNKKSSSDKYFRITSGHGIRSGDISGPEL